jgi:ABC-type uncharacterized transport system ATPase subunit
MGSPRRYRGQLALDDVSFDVECGSITGLLGRTAQARPRCFANMPCMVFRKARRKR